MKIAILGGGASSIFCASVCKEQNEIIIFEQNEKIGKKILATGNGRCNLTNINISGNTQNYYNQNINKYIDKFSDEQTLKFFAEIGLETYADSEGRVYPLSNSAISVQSVLKNYIESKKNIKIKNEQVLDIQKNDKNFCVKTNNGSYEFDKIVVALGNCADLNMFKKFGIKVKEFLPSLCALKTEKNKNLAGVRVSNVKVICKSEKFEENGEILFREDGISGIVIFNLSSFLARKKNYKTNIQLDFLPNISKSQLTQMLLQRKNNLAGYIVDDFLTGLLIKQLNYEILKKCNIDLNKKVSCLTQTEINLIVEKIKIYSLDTIDYLPNNQVCSGGVLLNELDDSLQSKKCEGLYFIGEVVDVDGICGGFNLQWAWTSGFIVGECL